MLRGIKTLAVRMRKHCENAKGIAAWLERHPGVEQVLYPGLPRHPGHEIAARQMRDFGGMISFLVSSEEEAVELVGRTKLFLLAESLGGVESLIELPARMTHASTADAPFAAPRNLIRLSVGIESVEDLIEDLELALVPSTAVTKSADCYSEPIDLHHQHADRVIGSYLLETRGRPRDLRLRAGVDARQR